MKKTVLLLLLLILQVTQAQEAGTTILSGRTRAFNDETNKFSVVVPVEFEEPAPGSPVLTFEGPNYSGGALSFHVNTVSLPSMPSDTLYGMYIKRTRKDPVYTDVTELEIPGGKGYMFKEIKEERDGTPKGPASMHRWHLAAFGGGRYYNCTMGGTFAAFDDPVVTKAFLDILESFTIHP